MSNTRVNLSVGSLKSAAQGIGGSAMLTIASQNTNYFIGLGLGFFAVVVVVALVAQILAFSSRIAGQAQIAAEALEVVLRTTDVLPQAEVTNEHALAILKGAETARGALTG